MDRMHARLLHPGDLAFDVGAHVGDRTASFRRLGAVVVAVEPQPPLARVLRLAHGRDDGVAVVAAAVGRTAGRLTLRLNPVNPTVATASSAFIEAAQGAPGWEGQDWRGTVEVACVTLDGLVALYGRPAFVKIDVEGYEAEALAGLSTAPRTLSFEFTTIQRDVATEALERLVTLGYRAFNAALGEGQRFVHTRAVDAEELADWLAGLPAEANSGDVYASLEPERLASGRDGDDEA